MIIVVDESFEKDFKKLQGSNIQKRIIEKIDALELASKLAGIPNIKVMKWFPDFYRMRIWEYRIGFKYENDTIILLRVRSRKEIYNIFP